jgi:hypothetical protein
MTSSSIEADFKKKVCDQIRLIPEGKDRFRVSTPFRFDDGDHLVVVLQRRGQKWVLTDEAHTFMHLSYRIDLTTLDRGTRAKIIERALASFGAKEEEGELLTEVDGEAFGDALYSFVQTLLRISDVSYLSKEMVRSAFMDDLRKTVQAVVPADRSKFDWYDEQSDPEKKYPVDCLIEGEKPLFLFGIQTTDKCSTATIVILHYQKAGREFGSLAVFENQEKIGRPQLARLSDVVDKQFSSLPDNRDRLTRFLTRHAGGNGRGGG